MIKILKWVILAFYFSVPLLAHWSLLSPYQPLLVLLFLSLLVIHLLEYAFFRHRLNQLNNGQNHFMQTIMFGFCHWLPLLTEKPKG
ncbi:hypothetical protein E3W66_08305 [Gammaproteobacteria bacterium LSUCC0057]|uniref:DUF1145 domain-containing protein n=1 Tax=Gammaproteobacteria bacterium LSUCC0057 TaxID=2559237 RepID=A0A4Y8UH55_9GAMM|nr:hypothetical protein E3W66_08305 [Gammaproteobacteria bacterium LSUCC0057]